MKEQTIVEKVDLKRYMISMVYAEQFTNAFAHYNAFLSLASRWNFTGVEPFVLNTRMSGFQMNPDSNYIDIRELLDMKLFHRRYAECVGGNKQSLIDPMNSFLRQSFRNIVVVYFSPHVFVLPREIHKIMDSSLKSVFSSHKDKPVLTCTDTAYKSLTPAVEDVLRKEQQKDFNRTITNDQKFSIKEVFCVNRDVSLSLVQLMDHLVNYLDSSKLNASVLFVSWQGKYTRPFTDPKTMYHCVLPFTQIPFSSKVKSQAAQFVKSKRLKPNDYISVHIRFAKLLEFAFNSHKNTNSSNQTGFYSCCMRRVQLLLEAVSNKMQIPLNRTIFIKDIGEHGTDACQYQGHWHPAKDCKEEAHKIISMLTVNASEYVPQDINGSSSYTSNAGFVSLVEEASLFDGRLLLTVGGGSFQKALADRFVDYHSNSTYSASDLHYTVCIQEKLNGLHIDHDVC